LSLLKYPSSASPVSVLSGLFLATTLPVFAVFFFDACFLPDFFFVFVTTLSPGTRRSSTFPGAYAPPQNRK
jgi:hypothetical protein